jgi:parvulin-like peptidyl-prolyl isomerase
MTRRLSLPLVSLAVLALVSAGCGGSGKKKSATPAPKPKNCTATLSANAVATVCDSSITRAQFNDVVGQARRNYKLQKRTFPAAGSPNYQSLVGQIMDFLVQRSEFAQKAAQMGIKVTDKQVENRLAQIKKQYFGGSEARYQQQLKQQGLTDAEVRDDLRAQLISDGLYRKVTAGVTVPDKVVSDYYKQHVSDQYTQVTPASRKVRHILVKSKKRADVLYTQLSKDPAKFPAFVQKYSTDPGSKKTGGQYTVSRNGQFVKPFEQETFKLRTKQISKPVHTQFGWHIIQALTDVTPEKKTVQPFSKVKSAIKTQLLSQKKTQAMQAWIAKTKAEFAGSIRYAQGFAPSSTSAGATTAAPTTTG